jgi:hypothetical protein
MSDITVLIDEGLQKRQTFSQETDHALDEVSQIEQFLTTLVKL